MVSVTVVVVVVFEVIEPCVKLGTTGTAYTEGIVLKRSNSKLYLFIVAQKLIYDSNFTDELANR